MDEERGGGEGGGGGGGRRGGGERGCGGEKGGGGGGGRERGCGGEKGGEEKDQHVSRQEDITLKELDITHFNGADGDLMRMGEWSWYSRGTNAYMYPKNLVLE